VWERSPADPLGWLCAATLEGHENEVKGVAWDASGALVATCGRDKSVWVWSCEAGGAEYECTSVLRGHAQDVKAVVWHPTLPVLFSASYDNTVREWQAAADGDDWHCTAKLDSAHSSTVWDVSLDPSGTRLASASDDSTVVIWRRVAPYDATASTGDTPVWVAEKSIRGGVFGGRPVYGVAWSRAPPPLLLLATACGDNSVRLFRENAATGEFEEVCCEAAAHEADVNCVAWCPVSPEDGQPLLASCGDDGAVKIWRVHLPS
jgi:WD40 repeat protein